MKPQQSSQRHSLTTNHNNSSSVTTEGPEKIDSFRDDIYIKSDVAFTSQDLTRVMIQSLYNLGFRSFRLRALPSLLLRLIDRESAAKLEMESGLQTQSCNVRQLISAIEIGNWQSCYQLVKLVEFTIDLKIVVGMITELVYIELILSKQTKEALNLLRTDLRVSLQDPLRSDSLPLKLFFALN
jgi:hypothetical protein